VPKQKPLEVIVSKADYLFLCVPSQSVRPATLSIKPFLKKKTGVICLSKGVELKTKKFMPEALAEILPPGQPFAMCGGPMLAEEIMQGQPGVSVLATKHAAAFKKLVALFSGSAVRLELSRDLIGVAVAGVLKNIYAMALGIADGLGWGANAEAWLVSQALIEMKKITIRLGGKVETVCYTAGLSDFIATAFSPYSKNRESGRVIAKTGKFTGGGEGFVSFPAVWKCLGSSAKKYPLLSLLKNVLLDHKDAKKLFESYFCQG
jgi:glycerol-3-phosphate dehydrogenase (NAD(P)+)